MLHIIMSKKGCDDCCDTFGHDVAIIGRTAYEEQFGPMDELDEDEIHFSTIYPTGKLTPQKLAELIEKNKGLTITWY